MNIKNTFGRAAGIVAAAVAIAGLGLTGTASASTASPAASVVVRGCSVQTINGHYLTAVGGGGRTTDVIHTDAVSVRAWETFSIVFTNAGSHVYGFRTVNGHYLTAVGGGGRITDTIHSDATRVGSWEKFRITCTG